MLQRQTSYLETNNVLNVEKYQLFCCCVWFFGLCSLCTTQSKASTAVLSFCW